MLPLVFHRCADNPLGFASRIHFRRIDQRHPEFEGMAYRRDFIRHAPFVLPHHPGAETDGRHACAAWKVDGRDRVVHGALLEFRLRR